MSRNKYDERLIPNITNGGKKRIKTEMTDREIETGRNNFISKMTNKYGTKFYNEMTDDERIQYQKFDCMSMMISILAYNCDPSWDIDKIVDTIMNNEFIDEYISGYSKYSTARKSKLGYDTVYELALDMAETYKKRAKVNRNVYTDSEGLTYNSLTYENNKIKSRKSKSARKENKDNFKNWLETVYYPGFADTIDELDDDTYKELENQYKQYCKSRGLEERNSYKPKRKTKRVNEFWDGFEDSGADIQGYRMTCINCGRRIDSNEGYGERENGYICIDCAEQEYRNSPGYEPEYLDIKSMDGDYKRYAYDLRITKQTRDSIYADSSYYDWSFRVEKKTGAVYKYYGNGTKKKIADTSTYYTY